MGKWSWRSEPELMARLNTAQNAPCNANVDITTFAGYCDSREQLERHVAYYEEKAARP